MTEPWHAYVSRMFPGYLLPAGTGVAIEREAAERFLSRFAGTRADLELVCAASLWADHDKLTALRTWAGDSLPELVRCLPATSEIRHRVWEAGYRGFLDIPRTLAMQIGNRPAAFVTRDRHRHYELAETVLARTLAERLVDSLGRLRRAGVIRESGWGAPLLGIETGLANLITGTRLREVPIERVNSRHLQAATGARHRAYREAASLHRWLTEALEDPRERARHLARGSLLPLSMDTRFEVAVLVKLVESAHRHVEAREPGRWRLERSAIVAKRSDVAALERDDGLRLEFLFNSCAGLQEGPRDRGVAHYLGRNGRFRPDVVVWRRRPGEPRRAVVIEVKRSVDPDYLVRGFGEALLYRNEYVDQLLPWPKAVLVAESGILGDISRSHDVVAVGWDRWAPESMLHSLIEQAA